MTLAASRVAAVLGDRTDVIESLAQAEIQARTTVDPSLLGLVEARIAVLLGHANAAWVDTSEFGDTERACVAFVEQWVIDVASMPDHLVAGVAQHLGNDGLMDFVHAVLVVEQRLRLDIAWQRLGFEA